MTPDNEKRNVDSGNTVHLQEVGPRDGLQNERVVLSPETRARLIDRLSEAGLLRIQIGSFVNPRKVPQMAGTDEVWRQLTRKPGTRYSVLVLNPPGLDRALAAGIPHVEIYVSASETHSMKNAGTTVERALKEGLRMVQTALQSDVGVTAGVMCAFGCFYEGEIPVARVLELVNAFNAIGSVEIALADTAGVGEPEAVRRLIESAAMVTGMDRLTIHLHDTRGFGMENLRAALEVGVRGFDTSVGGLGGCPFIPGAAGNIATEQTVDMLQSLGYETGVDTAKLTGIREDLARLLGESAGFAPMRGSVARRSDGA